MPRYVRNLELNKPMEFVSFAMNDFLQKNKFTPFHYKGEDVFRAGDAMLEGFKYIKWSYDGVNFHLEAWMQGSFGGEMDLDGFAGALQKKPFRESLEAQFQVLMQDLPQGSVDSFLLCSVSFWQPYAMGRPEWVAVLRKPDLPKPCLLFFFRFEYSNYA